jgi:hypothetical protein
MNRACTSSISKSDKAGQMTAFTRPSPTPRPYASSHPRAINHDQIEMRTQSWPTIQTN